MPISKDPEKRARQIANLTHKGFKGSTERARNAQRKSVTVQAEKRKSAERLREWLGMAVIDNDGQPRESVIYPGEVMQQGELLDLQLLQMGLDGNLEAIKYIEKLVGDAPEDNVNVCMNGGIKAQQVYRFYDLQDRDIDDEEDWSQ